MAGLDVKLGFHQLARVNELIPVDTDIAKEIPIKEKKYPEMRLSQQAQALKRTVFPCTLDNIPDRNEVI